jgi:hypothetical protein
MTENIDRDEEFTRIKEENSRLKELNVKLAAKLNNALEEKKFETNSW